MRDLSFEIADRLRRIADSDYRIDRGTLADFDALVEAARTIEALERQHTADGIRLRDEARYIKRIEAERDALVQRIADLETRYDEAPEHPKEPRS